VDRLVMRTIFAAFDALSDSPKNARDLLAISFGKRRVVSVKSYSECHGFSPSRRVDTVQRTSASGCAAR
jgi:hypothetical protein